MPDIFTAPEKLKPSKTNKSNENTSPKRPVQPPHSRPGIFSTFIKEPGGLKFAYQEEDEKILLFVRRHFITNLNWILISIIALFFPLLAIFLIQSATLPPIELPFSYMLIALSFYYLLVFGYAFYNFVHWFYNIGIITDKRAVDIDFLHLSYIDIAITQLPEIEDVVHVQKGFLESFFDYGDIIAHTVAGREDFVFEDKSHPAQIANMLSKLIKD